MDLQCTPSHRALALLGFATATLALLLTCAGGAASRGDTPPGPRPPDTATVSTIVYECRHERITVQILGDTAWVYFPDTTVALVSVPSASGAQYAGGEFLYWSKADEALIERGSRRYQQCIRNRREESWEAARLRGVDFRGLGQEPGWLLEIYSGDSIVFLPDYATRRIVTPAPEPLPLPDTPGVRYEARTGTHELDIRIVCDSCTDVMSGFRFEATVTVTSNGDVYQGCGRELGARDLLP